MKSLSTHWPFHGHVRLRLLTPVSSNDNAELQTGEPGLHTNGAKCVVIPIRLHETRSYDTRVSAESESPQRTHFPACGLAAPTHRHINPRTIHLYTECPESHSRGFRRLLHILKKHLAKIKFNSENFCQQISTCVPFAIRRISSRQLISFLLWSYCYHSFNDSLFEFIQVDHLSGTLIPGTSDITPQQKAVRRHVCWSCETKLPRPASARGDDIPSLSPKNYQIRRPTTFSRGVMSKLLRKGVVGS
jgi:hypothetical protein